MVQTRALHLYRKHGNLSLKFGFLYALLPFSSQHHQIPEQANANECLEFLYLF